jgi:hypothetical protein
MIPSRLGRVRTLPAAAERLDLVGSQGAIVEAIGQRLPPAASLTSGTQAEECPRQALPFAMMVMVLLASSLSLTGDHISSRIDTAMSHRIGRHPPRTYGDASGSLLRHPFWTTGLSLRDAASKK